MAEQESRLAIRIDSQNAKKTTDQLARALLNLEENGDQASQSASRLNAENKKLSNTLKNTTGNVSSANTALDSLVLSMRNVVFATTAASVGVTGFINNVASSAKIIQQYAELSKQSAEMFQYNAVGAKSAGFEMKDYGDILKDVYDRLGEVNRGEGEMMDFFERIAPKIGMTVEQFKNLSAHDALQAYYNGLERANLSHPEMITYMEQIANDSALLIPLLKENGKGFKELGDRAKEAGAIMSNEMVRDLNAARSEFNEIKMQAQGLGNELTVTLLPALRFIAANFEAITDAGIVLGMAAITKAMLDQFLAMQKSVAASVQRRAAAAAELQAQAQLAAVELQRSRQNVAIAAQEIHLARLDLNSATTKQARALAVQRLTAAEIAHNIALNANSKATAVNTAATTANNAAKTMGARAAALASAAFLGPAGIVIGVTALTAGYLLMSNNGDDANDMLKDQAGYAGMAADELERLSGNQAKAAKVDLTTAIKAQSQELKNVKRDFEDLVLALYKESDNKDLYRIWAEMTAGVLDTEEAFKRLNAVEGIEASDIKRAADYEKEHRDLNKTLFDSKEKLKLVENGIDGTGKKAKESAEEVANLTAELQKLFKQSNQDIRVLEATAAMDKNNVPKELMDIVNKYLNIEGTIDKATGKFNRATKDQINKEWIATRNSLDAAKERNKLEENRTKELEKQAKLVNSGTIDSLIARGEGGYNSVNLGKKHGYKSSTRNLTQMTVGQVMAAQDRGDFNAAGRNQIIKTTLREAVSSLKIDKNALFNEEMQDRILRDYLLGIKNPQIKGFITGKGTIGSAINALPKEFASFGVASDMQGAKRRVEEGESYYADVANNKASISAEEAANALLASRKVYQENLAAGMSAQQAWENTFAKQREVVGYTKDSALDLDKFLDEAAQAEADRQEFQAEERKRITNEVADYETQVRNRLKDELEKVDAAGFSDADAQKAKDFYEKQANLDIQAFKDAQQAKLDALKAFEFTEEQLINQSYDRKQADLKRDKELSIEQYTEASLALERNRKKELEDLGIQQESIRIANEKDILLTKQGWMDKKEFAKAYYDYVRQEALNNPNLTPQQKNAAVSQANAQQGIDENEKREDVWGQFQERFGAKELPYQRDVDLLKAAHDEMLITEEEYQQQRLALQMTYGAQYGGEFAGMLMGLVDQSSSAYALLGGIQKSAALFSTAMNSYTAISAAWASAPFPYNLPAVGMATMETGLLQAAVSALSPTGYKNGGLITGPGTGTSDSIPIMASNEEFMMRHAAVKSIGVDNLNYMNKYGKLPEQTNRVGNNIANTMNGNAVNVQVEPKIIVNVPEGFTAQQSQSSDGTITLDIVDQLTAQNLSTPNSRTNKAMRQNFNASPRR